MSPLVLENSIASPCSTLRISAISGGIVNRKEPPIFTRVLLRIIGIGDIAIRYTYILDAIGAIAAVYLHVSGVD